ncbi:hypothetical protein M422DRAFT_266549 [Sphaerobolus stellatus SS14]|uniref:Uncharacterized protein n=1 Tax=Sphaerobolus stellatus (strain SS14) TaxID=990650 RepID=A0A0C9UB53_SPHS4|nr:hypothetical protein M422DRAFT_266549 [Sphaerobolus stellatus SS14]
MLSVPELGAPSSKVHWGGMLRRLHREPRNQQKQKNSNAPTAVENMLAGYEAAFEEQTRQDEYRMGHYEANTPFTLANIKAKNPKTKILRRSKPSLGFSPTHVNPDFNVIPPTSPLIPNSNE